MFRTTGIYSGEILTKTLLIVEEAVISTELSMETFLSTLEGIGGCQEVDSENVEQWLAVNKDLRQQSEFVG